MIYGREKAKVPVTVINTPIMPNKPKWQSGEEVFDWWVYHIDDAKTDENQLSIDDIE